EGHDGGNNNGGLAENHGEGLGELSNGVRRLPDADAEGHGEADNGDGARAEARGGDEPHAGHGNGGEHRDGGAAEDALGYGGQQAGELGDEARQQHEARSNGEDEAVYDLVRRDYADVLGVGGRGQAAEEAA